MNKTSKFAVAGAVALALGGVVAGTFASGLVSVAMAADEKAEKPQVSAAAGPDLQAAQKAIAAGKMSEALDSLNKVAANAKKNEYDTYAMNSMLMQVYSKEGKQTELVKPLEALLASKYISPQQTPVFLNALGGLYFQQKNYDEAISYGERFLKGGYPDKGGQAHLLVVQSYYLKNDFKTSGKLATDMVDAQAKAGETPTEQLLQLGLSSASKQGDDAGVSRWLEKLVTYYPKPEYWQNVLDSLFRSKMPDRSLLQVYRLALDVGALKESGMYTDMAQLSLDAGSPGEAVTILQKGFDGNVFTQAADKNRNQHLLDTAKKQADADQPALPKLEAEAPSAADGNKFVGVGTGFFGYKQYDKAATDLAAGIAKGGLKDAIGAQLLLGVAQVKSGHKEDGIAPLKKVKGDPTLERVANLWVLHAKG